METEDHPKENGRPPLYIKVKLTEEEASIREKLIEILDGEVCCVSIALRNGRTIQIGSDPKGNPFNYPVEVWVGKDYIEVDIGTGGMVPVYGMVPLSEIVSVTHF